jgi:predicted ABC-type ATPase
MPMTMEQVDRIRRLRRLRVESERLLAKPRFNPNHEPAGSPEGGRFSSDGGSGGGGDSGGEGGSEKPASHKETAAKIVAGVPGATEKIKAAKAKLAGQVPTDAPTSKGGYVTASGQYTIQRQALHRDILNRDIFSAKNIAAATPKPGEKSVLHLLGGLAGSGKSWFTGPKGTIDKSKALYINSDDIKEALPDYKGWNSALVHEESSYLTKIAEAQAQRAGLNVILDGTMSNGVSLEKRVAQYKAAGYRIEGHYMRVKPETSAKRAVERFVNGGERGRLVDPEMILETGDVSVQNFNRVRDQMSASELYDNEGKEPKLISRR